VSLTEIQSALPSLTAEERKALQESLDALEEGVSVDELREINAALDEARHDPSPGVPADDVFAKMEAKIKRHAD
jgi:hypothetical protein